MMSEELLIDMSGIMDEETFYEYVSKKLNFPGLYGYNLDAFWDCITDENQSSMPQKLIQKLCTHCAF
ncbi:barstar family protein [Vibrio fortis]|uniref:barstar family protein n=1 Tax=Vibrio fortis TaxID=212667 RepID=UPI001CD9FC8A|nr:barstar family protein [Vibrio fortis]|tara:strand:+ start:967 stop:1167 length:201 start_codon:yes stop_codon:yes gene_type:complete